MGDMLLENKNAVIYGAGGSLGAAFAKAFASSGAKVFVTGRTLPKVENLAHEIQAAGGQAEAAAVDAMDETEVNAHLEAILQKGDIDISLNLIDLQVVQNKPLIELTVESFTTPPRIAMQSHFITATAAARAMAKQGRGVILSLTATPGGIGYPFTAGFAPACAALESFYRNLAAEAGIYGIRAVNIRSGGSPDSKVFADAVAAYPEEMKTILKQMEGDTMLKKMPLMADITNAGVFLASDLACSITGVTLDITAGTTAALNYRQSLETFGGTPDK